MQLEHGRDTALDCGYGTRLSRGLLADNGARVDNDLVAQDQTTVAKILDV